MSNYKNYKQLKEIQSDHSNIHFVIFDDEGRELF